MTLKQLTYKELIELARPSNKSMKNLVYIQFKELPRSLTMSDYYRVSSSFMNDDAFDNCSEPVYFERFGRGKSFAQSDGFARKTYMKQWCAFLVRKEPIEIAHISWKGE